MKIKKPSVAGQFYTGNKEALENEIKTFDEKSEKECEFETRAVIVPHAGHQYSGALAVKCLKYLRKDLETILIFAPAHRQAVEQFALPTDDAWEVPTGEILINKELAEEIKNMGGEYCDSAFMYEHSVEVQIPFIKYFLPETKIVPILVGSANYDKIAEIIGKYWENEKIGFVISSDLSHFRNKAEAVRIDGVTADMIENMAFYNMSPEQACGYIGICGLLEFAKSKDFSLIRVGMTDSSERTGDESSVVGYGAWYLAEQNKISFLKQYFSNIIKNLAIVSIKSNLDKINLKIENYPKALEMKVATFVTLKIQDMLRGCIGSIIGVEPLIIDVCKNARNAAFQDPRFIPLEADEFEKLSYSVSLLSMPEPMKFESEEDLLNQLVPKVDGLIIKDAGRQAVYLPEVWEQLPEKQKFLNSLKQKAGLRPDWFSNTFQAYKFRTELID